MGSRPDRVTATLHDLATLVADSTDEHDAAAAIVGLAQGNLECDYAGITIRRHRDQQLVSLATTDPLVAQCDELQYHFGQGPCVDSLDDQHDFAVDDVATDPRWPRWGPAVAELGVVSLLAVRMTAAGEAVGALNLYSTRPRHFSGDDVAFAHVFAHQAAAALGSVRRMEQLMTAVDGRTLIGQAQGVLMERFGLTPDQAFAVLRRCSQDTNTKLRQVAEDLVATGDLRQANPTATLGHVEQPTHVNDQVGQQHDSH